MGEIAPRCARGGPRVGAGLQVMQQLMEPVTARLRAAGNMTGSGRYRCTEAGSVSVGGRRVP